MRAENRDRNGHYTAAGDGDAGIEIYHISIQPSNNILKSLLDIDANNKVDFTTANSIRTVLGFNNQLYSVGYNESENIVNIMNVNSLRVTSDLSDLCALTRQRKTLYISFPECWSWLQNYRSD